MTNGCSIPRLCMVGSPRRAPALYNAECSESVRFCYLEAYLLEVDADRAVVVTVSFQALCVAILQPKNKSIPCSSPSIFARAARCGGMRSRLLRFSCASSAADGSGGPLGLRPLADHRGLEGKSSLQQRAHGFRARFAVLLRILVDSLDQFRRQPN